MTAPLSIFKTPELEKQYFTAYEAVLELWPVAHEILELPTNFGRTHINATGSKDNQAMVLLPGFDANSTMWFPNIAALSSQFHVFAIDTSEQLGKSIPGENQ